MRLPDHAPPLFMVFDVESIGLHGEGFAVGYVIVDSETGREEDAGLFHCSPDRADGRPAGRDWIEANVPDLADCCPGNPHHNLPDPRTAPRHVRDLFWWAWERWKANGAILAADCPWPVEARFLLACVADDPIAREWQGPYPLIDVASVRLAAGFDPLATVDRLPDELPAHNPLADARQSARLLIEALSLLARPGPEQP
jgi:hypothetical protein